MSITRDDLRIREDHVWAVEFGGKPFVNYRPITDEDVPAILRALLTTECETCGGSGKDSHCHGHDDDPCPCPDCDGEGRVLAEEMIECVSKVLTREVRIMRLPERRRAAKAVLAYMIEGESA